MAKFAAVYYNTRKFLTRTQGGLTPQKTAQKRCPKFRDSVAWYPIKIAGFIKLAGSNSSFVYKCMFWTKFLKIGIYIDNFKSIYIVIWISGPCRFGNPNFHHDIPEVKKWLTQIICEVFFGMRCQV